MDKYIPIESLYSALNFIEQSAVKGEEDNVKCITKAIRAIEFVPVDVVKVVRCKDCKMYRKDKELAKAKYCDPNYYCGLLQAEMDEDGFCSYGRRKDE